MKSSEGLGWVVRPEYSIVPFFWPFIAIAIRQRFSRIDGADHQHGETPQYFPSLAVQQVEFQADFCLATNAFCTYGNS
jgi:hypothetical protein